MTRHTVATLYALNPSPRGAFEPAEPTKRTVFCTVRSVGMRESYEALSHGLRPELVLVLAQDFEYHGEGYAIVDGVHYRILRTYVTQEDGVELTLERKEDRG